MTLRYIALRYHCTESQCPIIFYIPLSVFLLDAPFPPSFADVPAFASPVTHSVYLAPFFESALILQRWPSRRCMALLLPTDSIICRVSHSASEEAETKS